MIPFSPKKTGVLPHHRGPRPVCGGLEQGQVANLVGAEARRDRPQVVHGQVLDGHFDNLSNRDA